MNNKIVNTFEKGLVRLDNKVKQPKNSYSYALNAAPNDVLIDRSTLTNERDFDNYFNLKNVPYEIIGYEWLGEEEYVLFIKHTEPSTSPFNEIWYVDIKKNIKSLKYSNLALNFQDNYLIMSTHRVNYKNERLVYFVDGLNDDRVFNIDKEDLMGMEINMLSINSSEIKANVDISVEDSGGTLKAGQYFVAVSYKDENGYVTSPSEFSLPVSIGNGNYNVSTVESGQSSFYLTKGVLSDSATSKKLKINISNIDQRYNKIIIYIIQRTDTFSRIYRTEELNVFTDSYEFEFNGFNAKEDTSILLDDLIVDRVNYFASNVITQKENRLIRANLKIKENNINYQSIANNIKVRYKITEELVYDAQLYSLLANPSNPLDYSGERHKNNLLNTGASTKYLASTGNSMQISKSFMRDEVYALGISFELEDGTSTDVFHIPGRKKTDLSLEYGEGERGKVYSGQINWDSESVLGKERWMVESTAIKRDPLIGINDLSYWRSEDVYEDGYGYPTDGEKDINGKSYIRHHKMPSEILEPIIRTEKTNKGAYLNQHKVYKRNLSLIFDNIEIPEEYRDIIVKVKIHYAKRDNSNKSVISKGLIFGSSNKGVQQFNSSKEEKEIFQFISPETDFKFKQFPINASFFKPTMVFKGYINYFGDVAYNQGLILNSTSYFINLGNSQLVDLTAERGVSEELLVGSTILVEATTSDTTLTQKEIQNAIFIDSNGSGSLGSSTSSFTFKGESNVVGIRLGQNDTLSINYSTYNPIFNYEKSSVSNYFQNSNLNGDKTTSIDPYNSKLITDTYYDTFIYGALIFENRRQYGSNLKSLIYEYSGAKEVVDDVLINNLDVNNGDTFIDMHTSKKGYYIENTSSGYNGVYARQVPERDRYELGGIDISGMRSNSYISYFVETDINIKMRNSDPNLPESDLDFFPIAPLNKPSVREMHKSLEKKSLGSEYYNVQSFYNIKSMREFYAVNKELDSFNNTNLTSFSNRLIYSNQQSYESSTDSFRLTRANNYRDLPMDKGPITQMFNKDEQVYVITRDALFNVFASNKTIQSSDNSNIVVGTGEFFGLEPVELITIDGGFGGTQSKLSLVKSPYGYLFVDSIKNKVLLFNDTFSDLNIAGLNENFNFELPKRIKQLENISKFDSPISGYGISSVYDPRLHRFLITKKDYIPLSNITSKFKGNYNEETSYNEGDKVLKDGKIFSITANGLELIPFTNKAFFENKSFTVSYDPLNQCWISYHSEIPKLYLNHPTDFLIFNDINVKKSHSNNFKQSPFIIETVFNEAVLDTKVFDSIVVNCSSVKNDGTVIKDFFNKLIVYTETQSSGEIELNKNNMVNHEKNFNINRFLDISKVTNNKKLFNTDWESIKNSFPIDKVVNESQIDNDKPWHLRGRFRDKYFVARFIHNNLHNSKILLNFVSSNFRISKR